MSILAASVLAQSGSDTGIRPFLKLEKPKYLLGESVRFWVGVEVDPNVVVPNSFKTCSLQISNPDGSTENQPDGWPTDGNPDGGWMGGTGIKPKTAGEYTLVYGCGTLRSQPTTLVVVENPIADQIKAKFHFERSGATTLGTTIPVVLVVENDSPYAVRFPQRGVMMEGVWVRVTRDQPAYRSDFFYPWEKLTQSRLAPLTYTWDVAAKLPSIVLSPGKRFEQRLLLNDAYEFEQPGTYAVTFGTVLSVLVGDEHGPLADLCPIRILAEETATFRLFESRAVSSPARLPNRVSTSQQPDRP